MAGPVNGREERWRAVLLGRKIILDLTTIRTITEDFR